MAIGCTSNYVDQLRVLHRATQHLRKVDVQRTGLQDILIWSQECVSFIMVPGGPTFRLYLDSRDAKMARACGYLSISSRFECKRLPQQLYIEDVEPEQPDLVEKHLVPLLHASLPDMKHAKHRTTGADCACSELCSWAVMPVDKACAEGCEVLMILSPIFHSERPA